MVSPLLYGLNAGLGMSPHTLGSILTALEQGKLKGYSFVLGGLLLDVTLIFLVYALGADIKLGEVERNFMNLFSGLMTIRMGVKVFSAKPKQAAPQRIKNSLGSGFLIQTFNPNPYLFWFAIGLPTMISARSGSDAFAFCLIFLSVTYILKLIILEFSVRASSIKASSQLAFVRKTVAVLTIVSGFSLIFHTTKGIWT